MLSAICIANSLVGTIIKALYGVESIPTNFLVDNKGIIVAKNLRGEALEAELQKWAVK